MLHGVLLLAPDGRADMAGLETQDAGAVMCPERELGGSAGYTSLDLHSSVHNRGEWQKGPGKLKQGQVKGPGAFPASKFPFTAVSPVHSHPCAAHWPPPLYQPQQAPGRSMQPETHQDPGPVAFGAGDPSQHGKKQGAARVVPTRAAASAPACLVNSDSVINIP